MLTRLRSCRAWQRSLWIGNTPARSVRGRARSRPSPVRCDGFAHDPRPATAARRWFRAARSALGRLQLSCYCAGGPAGLRGPGQWADSLGPPAARRPWRGWAPAAGPPSVVTEVGCRWSSRPLAAVGNSPRPISSNAKVGPSGRGEWQPGMGMPEISMPSDAFCSGAHVTLAPHCVHSASRSKQTSIAKSKVPRL